jgi:HAD superfamily hydrolase (TIGR01450 family)
MTLRGIVLDLDGTIYHGENLLPGASEAVDRLRERGLSLCFFSNNPLHDGEAYVDLLQSMGVDAREGEACSSAVVTREYIDQSHAGDTVFVIGSESIRDDIRATNATITTDPQHAEVLVGSWTDEFDYADMIDALRAAQNGVVFLGTDPDITFPGDDGKPVPGSGAVINAIASVIDKEPDRILGKPSSISADAALDRLGHDPSECLVVGDRLSTDIALGKRVGMETVLVRTGVTDETDLPESDVTPDHIIDSIAELESVLE